MLKIIPQTSVVKEDLIAKGWKIVDELYDSSGDCYVLERDIIKEIDNIKEKLPK